MFQGAYIEETDYILYFIQKEEARFKESQNSYNVKQKCCVIQFIREKKNLK